MHDIVWPGQQASSRTTRSNISRQGAMHCVSRRWERLNVEIQHCDYSGEPIIGKLWSKGRREGWVGKTVVSMGGTVSKLNLVHDV